MRKPTRPGLTRSALSTVVLVALLTFVPALFLGPVVQGLTDRLF